MSKKTVNTTQFAPAGMNAYNAMTPQASQNMQQFMTDPAKSSFFNNMFGQSQQQIGLQGQTQMQTLMNNIRQIMGGGGASSPFMASQVAQQGRFQGGQTSNAFNNLLLGTNQLRFGATQGALGYNPLQTGQTQQVSGVGSWLPQLLGAGLGAASGLSGLGKFAGGAAMNAGNLAMPSPFTMGQQSPFGGQPMAPPNFPTSMPGGMTSAGGGFGSPYLQ